MADGPPPFDWSKLTSKENLPKTLGVAGAIVALIVLLSISGGIPSMPGQPGGPADRFANADSTGGGPVPLTPIAEGQCQTYAPSGWTVVETNPNGTFFRTASADQSMQAAYVGMGMHGDLNIPGLANFQTTPPNVMLQQVIGAISNAAVNVTADGETFGGYTVMRFTSGNYSGYALYYRASQMPDFTLPDGGQSAYILIARIAFGANGDNRSVATAGSVAAAIRCTAIVIPHPIGGDTDRSSSHGAGTSAKCSGGGSCDDSDLAGTYNAQLGTGWVHDSLGRNYNVDVTADYNDNGPDGPGYYASVGGTQEKLQPGLQ